METVKNNQAQAFLSNKALLGFMVKNFLFTIISIPGVLVISGSGLVENFMPEALLVSAISITVGGVGFGLNFIIFFRRQLDKQNNLQVSKRLTLAILLVLCFIGFCIWLGVSSFFEWKEAVKALSEYCSFCVL